MGLRCCCCPQNDHERNIGRWLEEGGGGPLLAAGIGRSPVAGLAASVVFLFGWPNAGSNSRRKAVPVLALAPLSQQCAHGTVQHGAARCSTSPPGGATAPQGSGGARRLALWLPKFLGADGRTPGQTRGVKRLQCPRLPHSLAHAGRRRRRRVLEYAAGCRDRVEPGGRPAAAADDDDEMMMMMIKMMMLLLLMMMLTTMMMMILMLTTMMMMLMTMMMMMMMTTMMMSRRRMMRRMGMMMITMMMTMRMMMMMMLLLTTTTT